MRLPSYSTSSDVLTLEVEIATGGVEVPIGLGRDMRGLQDGWVIGPGRLRVIASHPRHHLS